MAKKSISPATADAQAQASSASSAATNVALVSAAGVTTALANELHSRTPIDDLTVRVSIEAVAPLTFTHHGDASMPLLRNGATDTVYWPASALRGALRQGCSRQVLRRLDTPPTLDWAYRTFIGQSIKMTSSCVPPTPAIDAQDEQHRLRAIAAERKLCPITDLFGAWRVPARLSVSHLLPDTNTPPVRVALVRRDLSAETVAMLPDAAQSVYEDRKRIKANESAIKQQLRAVQAALRKAHAQKNDADIAALQPQADALSRQIDEAKALDESKQSSHLAEFSAIPAGIVLRGVMRVSRPIPLDVALLRAGFDAITREPLFGGHRARGCGTVRGTATFLVDGEIVGVLKFGATDDQRLTEEWESHPLADLVTGAQRA